MKLVKYLLVLLSLLCSSALAAEVDLEKLAQKAASGDPAAQFELGKHYWNQEGTGQEAESIEEKGFDLMWQALANEYPPAELYFGARISDKEEGLRLISRAANSGLSEAELLLGNIYRTRGSGYGLFDVQKSKKWLERVARKSDWSAAESQLMLSMLYQGTDDWPHSKETSRVWFTHFMDTMLSLESVDEVKTNGALANGFNAPGRMRNLDLMYMFAAAELGDLDIQTALGELYLSGLRVSIGPEIGRIVPGQDLGEALYWLERAASSGSGEAHYYLGIVYENPTRYKRDRFGAAAKTIEKDAAKAARHYEAAAKQGNESAKGVLEQRGTYNTHEWNSSTNRPFSQTRHHGYDFGIIDMRAHIGYSKAQEKRLYIRVSDYYGSLCTEEGDSADASGSVWTIDGQAVAMFEWCVVQENGRGVISATPRSERGMDYVVSALKGSPNTVTFEAHGLKAPISAIGFTRSWAKVSGEVL